MGQVVWLDESGAERMFDKEPREQEVIDFIRNKIKRGRQCGNELDYKEKYFLLIEFVAPVRG